MIRPLTVILFLLMPVLNGLGQNVISVSLESRDEAMKLTSEAYIAIEASDFDKAYSLIKEALRNDSTYLNSYLRLYQICMNQPEKISSAKEFFSTGKRIFQENDEMLFYSGEINRLDKCYDQAIEDYTLAMEYAKNNGEDYYLVPFYYLNRGNIFLYRKEYGKALSDYNTLLKLDSLSVSGLTNRGITYFQMDRTKDACRDWKDAKDRGNKAGKYYYHKYCDGIQLSEEIIDGN